MQQFLGHCQGIAVRILNRLEEGIIALLLAIMALVTFFQVVLRYVFRSGLIWGMELTLYAFAWLVLFGMSYGVKQGIHIGVDVYVKALAPARRRIVGLVAGLLCILYAAIALVGAWNYFFRMYRLDIYADDLAIKRWKLLIILPLGFAMLLCRLVQSAIRIWAGKEAGFRLGDEGGEAITRVHPSAAGSNAHETRQ